MINFDGQNIISVDIDKEVRKSFLDYSMSVIVSRALPDVRDGLKPVHRRILYTLHENGLTPDKAYRKCADTVGSVLGRYHPHGDAAVYDALVRMAQDFSMRYILVDGHGNFGSIDGDSAAAYRYTESRMAKISLEMLADIDKDTVDFTSNYDDRLQEPVVLPSRYPNLLVNGSTGIAVGMATNIPPHNLGETIDGVCCLLENPEAELDDIMEHIKGPDFPTGGIIMGRSGIRAAYATGRGKITLRARANIEEEKNGRFRIVVTEIPYMVNKARLVESIADLVKDKRIDGISDLRDESDRDGMRVVIELKRDANAQVVLNQLYKFSQMQETVGAIMLALADGEPKVMSLKEIIQRYIRFQMQVITRRVTFDLHKAQERAHILEALKTALDFIDEVIAILRSSKSINEGKARLMERFNFDDVQATAIVQMRLGQLTGLEREKIEEELAELEAKIADLLDILAHEERVRAIIREELLAIKAKFADPRRTEIAMISGEVDIEDLIPVEDNVVTMTHYGYLKRQPTDTYRTQKRGGRGVTGMTTREEDFAEEMFVSSTHDYIMFFSNTGRVYRLKCYEIPEGSRTSKGMNLANLLPVSGEEKITSMLKVPQFEEHLFLCMITKNGVIKRTPLQEYDSARKGGLIAINLDEGDELAYVTITDGSDELLVATRYGMAIRFREDDARSLGRSARGVKAIELAEGDYVVGMAKATEEGTKILTVTETGNGRRTEMDDYRLQARGGKGSTNYKTENKGLVASVKAVHEDEDLIIISDDGIIIRIPAGEISVQSRYAGGVRVMRLAEGTKVVSVAATPREDDEEDAGQPVTPGEAGEAAGESQAAEGEPSEEASGEPDKE